MDILQERRRWIKLQEWREIRDYLSDLSNSGTGDHSNTAKMFLDLFTTGKRIIPLYQGSSLTMKF
jgi:hypothetical protein